MWRSLRLAPSLAPVRRALAFETRSSQYRPKSTAVDDRAKLRLENPFWNKKIDRAIRVRDADKDGVITRKDFELIVQRYKDLGGISGEQLQESIMKMCDFVGLDDTKQFTYEEFKRHHANFDNHSKKINTIFRTMFNGLDIDGEGVVSMKEWELHYRCMGLDPKYAKASFEAMDTNGDGVVSLEEFVAYNLEFYSSTENKLNSAILFGPLD